MLNIQKTDSELRDISHAEMFACASDGKGFADAHVGASFTMRGMDLFEMLGTGTISVVLNPNCPAGKEFFVEEMRNIAGVKFFELLKPEIVQKERKISLWTSRQNTRMKWWKY